MSVWFAAKRRKEKDYRQDSQVPHIPVAGQNRTCPMKGEFVIVDVADKGTSASSEAKVTKLWHYWCIHESLLHSFHGEYAQKQYNRAGLPGGLEIQMAHIVRSNA